MVQVLKDALRRRIVEAARLQFSKNGFTKATIGAIAGEAGVADGTIYKYFSNKKVLFESIMTDEFVGEFLRLTHDRIAGFAQPGGMDAGRCLGGDHPGEFLRFIIRNPHEVIILLSRAEGTKYEPFVREYIRDMESQTLRQAREQFPRMEVTPTFRFMVNHILEDSVQGMVSILERFGDEASIREAFAAMARYHLAGIVALIEWNAHSGRK